LAAITRGPDRHFSARSSLVELTFDMHRFVGFVAPRKALVQAVQAPDISGVLAGSAQGRRDQYGQAGQCDQASCAE